MEQPNEPKKKNRESSNRWQGRTIEQFGYALNLVLGLTIASIGYETTIILNKEMERADWQNCLLAISLLALVLSVAVALWCIVTRLRNFRITAEIARKREDGESDIKLQPLRTKASDFGEFTWILFWWQIWSFAIGVLLLMALVARSLKAAM